MDDMRTSTYLGFVILLKSLNSAPNSLHGNEEVIFLFPSVGELSKLLQSWTVSNSHVNCSVHCYIFHNGSLVPSSAPIRTLKIIIDQACT